MGLKFACHPAVPHPLHHIILDSLSSILHMQICKCAYELGRHEKTQKHSIGLRNKASWQGGMGDETKIKPLLETSLQGHQIMMKSPV